MIDLGTDSEPNALAPMSKFQVPTCEFLVCAHVPTPNNTQIAVAERMLLLMFPSLERCVAYQMLRRMEFDQ